MPWPARATERGRLAVEVPTLGIVRTQPPYAIGPAALWSGDNVIVRDGVLRPRDGLTVLDASTTFTAPPTGLFGYRTIGDVATPVLATTQRLYAFQSGAWVDRTQTLQTASPDQVARFTSIVTGTPSVSIVIHVNGKDAPQQWDGAAATFTTVAGSPPAFTDVATVADVVVGLVPPYRVQWCASLSGGSIGVWPALNRFELADTPDEVVAIRATGPLTAIVYKARSLWALIPTGASSEARLFRREFLGDYDGPAGPAAVVSANGVQVYMTPTGRVAQVGPNGHRWIAEGVWPVIRDEIDPAYPRRIVGWYHPTVHEVVFAYPRLGDAGACYRLLWLAQSGGAFLGTLAVPISAAATVRFADQRDRVVVAGSAAPRQTYTVEGANDAGTAITGHWQSGLIAWDLTDPTRALAVETLAARGNGYGRITLSVMASQSLADDGHAVGRAVDVDLGTPQDPVRPWVGVESRSRFLGLRYAFSTDTVTTLRWKGAVVYEGAPRA